MKVDSKIYGPAACLLIAFVILGGCAADPNSEPTAGPAIGKIFRHRWWNYYARGLSAAEHREYSRAIADLRTALQQRDRDQRMARTYGMHFVDYFPHRELGILFWEKQQLSAAQTQLEISIAQTPTAKAFYYLDRVKEEQIRRRMKRGAAAIPPPDIRFDAPEKGIHTRENPVVIRGTVSDAHYVSSVKIGDETMFLERARKRIDVRRALTLSQGVHRIHLKARSLSGLSREKVLTVRVDRQGPVIDIQAVKQARDGSTFLNGRLIDPAGVASLVCNQKPVGISAGAEVPFRIHVTPDRPGITISASDQLGNETRSRFHIRDLIAAGRPGQDAILLASRAPLISAGRLFQSGDRQAPSIQLRGWTASQTVYMDKAVIEGNIRDNHRIVSVTINGEPLFERPLAGVWAAFSSTVLLNEGRNVFSITAADEAGNRAVEEITIIRKRPKAQLLSERLSVSILPFAQRGDITPVSDAFQDVFMHRLSLQKRFKLVDRSRLDLILQEHRINRTDLIAPETALRTGRLCAADMFISGSIIKTRMGTEIFSRLVDTETTELVTMVDAYMDADALQYIQKSAEQLAVKIHREFPLVDGQVLKRQKQFIFTDLGSEKLRVQQRILVVREEPVLHPVTNHPLGSDYQVLGRARLVQIQPDFSKGVLNEISDPAICNKNGVMTR